MTIVGPPILVSACLAGCPCRYDGQAKGCPAIIALVEAGRAVPFCPETAGGLDTPREPAEIQGGTGADVLAGRARVIARSGDDVTAAYLKGARQALALVQNQGIRQAVLQERSPACGVKMIYDGSHTGRLRPGQGVMAAALLAANIQVKTSDNEKGRP